MLKKVCITIMYYYRRIRKKYQIGYITALMDVDNEFRDFSESFLACYIHSPMNTVYTLQKTK